MKTLSIKKLQAITLIVMVSVSINLSAQIGGWKPDLVDDSEKALAAMIKKSPKLESFKDKSYGYAIFPKITKGAIGIGGAGGQGVVYKDSVPTGHSGMSQATIGLQLGGQQYSEVIFFENKDAYDNFINEKVKFNGQTSVVAITSGASADVAFKGGMAVFTMAQGGLMFEASVGGQRFKFTPKE